MGENIKQRTENSCLNTEQVILIGTDAFLMLNVEEQLVILFIIL